jgi:transcriptional regulator with XRE-family HTH domain
MPGRFRRVDEIPRDQAAVVGANIRILRQQHGWNQAKLGELMGWPSNSTVCAAEGSRNGRQRDSPLARLSDWPPSSVSPYRSSRYGAPTAAATRQPGSPV